MEELKGIGSLAEASGSPLLASLNEAAQLGSRARTDLLARYEDASAEVRSPETAHDLYWGLVISLLVGWIDVIIW